nr:MAG TPA: Integrase [Caudoviricetes sp.]
MASVRKYATAKGHAWRVQYRSPDGKSRTKQGFRTKAEAQAWANKNAVAVHDDDWINPNAGKVTVGDLGQRWLDMQTHLKPSTKVSYEGLWNTSIEPYWGPRTVKSISRSDVQEWVAKDPHSASWRRNAHNLLAQILDMAVADRRIRENPARGIKLPRKEKTVKVYLTMQQLRLFARECKTREDLVLLLGTSGLRWGEAIALRPVDLDPLRGRISVTRSLSKTGNGVSLTTPKSHQHRTVAVAGFVMDRLMQRAEPLGREDLLFTSPAGTFLRTPGKDSWFTWALKRAQKKDPTIPYFSPHGLRHVAAGLLVQSGANVKAVQAQLGHANASQTLDTYAELFDDGLDDIAATLDKGFSDVVGLSCDAAK